MRIIAGEKRGLKLASKEGLETRPTLDRVKEALFGRLQFEIINKCVLDLFAGSGALGLEALSRGAKEAILVDHDANAGKIIEQNIASANMKVRAQFIKNDFVNVLKLFQNSRKFDIVFIDPPYRSGLYEEALYGLIKYEVLHENGIVVTESDRPIDLQFEDLVLEKEKRYGKVYLTFFRWKGKQ